MGPYCKFCEHRCFVLRDLPDRSWSGLMATCAGGMRHDRRETGHDHTTAVNPVAGTVAADADIPAGLAVRQHNTGWRIIHTASGLHLPMLGWPDSLPRAYALAAVRSLAASPLPWTSSSRDLRANLPMLGEVTRAAALAARELALADDNPSVLADTHDLIRWS